MLTKRTNILFDQNMWTQLTKIAQVQDRSVGDLVRSAVVRVYLDNHEQLAKERKDSIADIFSLRQSIKTPITVEEIHQFILYGRKH